ncbi:MAG: hypothetical protein AAF415_00550 [Pseudomonadota bacterium]
MRRAPLIIALTALLASPLPAAEPIDLLFYTQHLEQTAPEVKLHYLHTRQGASQALGPTLESAILLRRETVGDDLEIIVTLDADGAGRQLDSFRGVPGNPILMVFMESIVGSLSKATGGSPFYIRNRLKEGFAAGQVFDQAGESTILMEPFLTDRNRHRMGPFANLQIEMTLDPARPGMFGTLNASVRDPDDPELLYYLEEMRFVEAN